MGVHKTACLTNLFSRHWYCLEASDLICSTYWLIVFFVVGMSTGGVFRAGYTISFFLSLAFSLLDFLGPLLIVYEYSDIFYKMFFQYSGLCFSIEMVFGQFWMSWLWRYFHWCHFMVTIAVFEHPFVYWKVFHLRMVIKHNTYNRTKNSKVLTFFTSANKIRMTTRLYSVLLLLGDDIKLSPGLKQISMNAFTVCPWNLNSISAHHNYAKIFLLNSCNAIHKFCIICLSETYLDSILHLIITIWKFLVVI